MQPKVFYLYELDPGKFPFKVKWYSPSHPLHNLVLTVVGIGSKSYSYKLKDYFGCTEDIVAQPQLGIGWTSEHDATKMIDKAINNLFVSEKV